MYLVNDNQLFIEEKLANLRDYVLVGRERLKVVFRGKRRIEALVYGEIKKRALVLENVAYIPGFYINIVLGFLF